MENLLYMQRNAETGQLSKELGFTRTLFAEEVVLLTENNKKTLLRKIQQAKQQKKIVICKPLTEELLRFVLEKTSADMVVGMENIHPKDSVHYLRSGLDQVLCRIACERKKIIAFSFADLLHAPERAKAVARMMFNLRLCQKYKVKMLFSNFSSLQEEMRSAQDLFALWRVLGGRKKEDLQLLR